MEHGPTNAGTLSPRASSGDAPGSTGEPDDLDRVPGLAHVAALAFVAARTVPGLGFPVAAGGGIALSRATQRLGIRRGIGAAIGAILEAVAILGPARLGAPLGQATTAPAVGGVARRGGGVVAQTLSCAAIRTAFNVIATLFFIFVIAGGIETYAGAYDSVLGAIPGVPEGVTAALVATAVGIALWGIGASAAQVWAYRRATRRWSLAAGGKALTSGPTSNAGGNGEREIGASRSRNGVGPGPIPRRRPFDPRAVTLAAAVAFALLLVSTDFVLLGAVTVWLTLAWLVAPADREVVPAGFALAAALGTGAFVTNLLGGEGLVGGLEHAARAALLVLVATWMRGAAGADGFKEVARRVLDRLQRLPSVTEASETLDGLGSERRMGEAVRSLAGEVRGAAGPLLLKFDAVLRWIAVEAERFEPAPGALHLRLAYRPFDAALLTIVAVPALAFGLPAA